MQKRESIRAVPSGRGTADITTSHRRPTAPLRRPEPHGPLLVVGAAGSGIRLATSLVAALGWHSDTEAVRRLHDELFARMHWSAEQPPTSELVHAAADRVRPHVQTLAATMAQSAAQRPIVIGDPRLAFVLPWWRTAVPPDTRFVLCVRDPVDTAMCLRDRAGIPLRHAVAWWEHQVIAALMELHGAPVHVFPFARVVATPDAALDFARTLLAPTGPEEFPTGSLRDAIHAIVRPATSRAGGSEHSHDELLTVRQRDLWTFLSILPAVAARLDVPSAWRKPSRGTLAALFERHTPAAAPAAAPATAPDGEPPPERAELDALTARCETLLAERAAALAACGRAEAAVTRAEAARKTAEMAVTQYRHQLHVATYEHANLRATLYRIETARQQLRDSIGALRERTTAAEAAGRQATIDRDAYRSGLIAVESSRLFRWRTRIADLARRLRSGGRFA